MTETKSALRGAIKIGEVNADQAIRYAIMATDLRRSMWRAVRLLRIGKTSEALMALEKGLIGDNR